ncbi:MAG: restriction endonuclease subunit S [Pseudomonadota bacterium]
MRESRADSWIPTTLEAITKRLVNGGTPPTEIQNYWKGDTPWITGADFTGAGIGEFRRFVSQEAVTQTATNVIAKGELLLVTRTGVGKLAIAPCDIAISQDITGVYPDREKVDVAFLYHRMRQGVEDLKKLNQGTSINGIVRRDLLAYPIDLPPLAQQRCIAEILSTLDEAIEQTEALIAKMQQIKAGLMHDIFTRGVTPDGQLRPPRETAPQLYKESPLGWIPKEWETRTLRSCLVESPVNGIYKPASEIGSGALLVGQTAFTPERSIDFDLSRRASITQDELRRYGLVVNDILVSRVFATIDGVGQPTLVPIVPEPAVYESNMMRLRCDMHVVRPVLLFEWLRSHVLRRFIINGASASNQTSINQRVLNSLPIPLPDGDEQHRIIAVVQAHDNRYEIEQRGLKKLQQLKRGLMHDLLTGTVRVPLAAPVPEAAHV